MTNARPFRRGDIVRCSSRVTPASKNSQGLEPPVEAGDYMVVHSTMVHSLPVISFHEDGPLYNAHFFTLVPNSPMDPFRNLSEKTKRAAVMFRTATTRQARAEWYPDTVQEGIDAKEDYDERAEALGNRLRELECFLQCARGSANATAEQLKNEKDLTNGVI